MQSKLTCLLLGILLSTGLLFGQSSSGAASVTGRVTDATGAVVPSASVTITETSTNISKTVQTNASGLYLFNDIDPGVYDISVTSQGFRKAVIRHQEVLVATAMTVDVALEVGGATEVVEVRAEAGAELQTLNATMGSSITSDNLLDLPTLNRDVNSLLFLQPMTAPAFNGASNNITSGQVAGNMSDQNTYFLDGGNATSDFDGDNGTYVGSRSAVVPTPSESVEEFRVNTNNMTSDFGFSGGGQMLLTTKRGTNQFHGSVYDYFQSDVLSSNDWFNNYEGVDKPKAHYNRFGGAFGGPVGPEFLGGKTYFYMNYEGERYPRNGPINRTVPSATLREGILEFRDANGNVQQYNLATSTACGANGGMQCDPRGLGISPTISQMWSKYEPACNNNALGDGLNTCGYLANLSYPLSTNFGVVRIDHDFGSKWRWFSSYRYFREENPTTNQVDIGGLLPGDTFGQPASASAFPVQPRYFTTGLTGTLTPNLTNELHLSYTRNQWQYLRAGAQPQLPGLDGALEIGGESTQALIPINVDTQDARNRLWDGHDYGVRDSVSWLKGTHLLQFGGEYTYDWWLFDRYDNVVGGLTQLVEDVNNTGVNMTSAYQPIPCTATQTGNCLPSGNIGNWNQYYAEVLGFVDTNSIVVSRSGSNLNANPLGSPVRSEIHDPSYSLFFNDSWKIKPNLTLSYGLNWTLQMPPVDVNGAQDILTTTSGQPITINGYLDNVERLANMGQVYNPLLAFTPVGDLGAGQNKYPYHPFYGGFGPRVALAWNPESKGDGFWAKLLGNKATVVRVGFGRFYSRSLAAGLVSTSVLGDGFLQPVACQNPNSSGVCAGTGAVNPTNAFRIGVDGTNAPNPTITPTLTAPVVPCGSASYNPACNAPYAELVESLDQAWKPVASNSIDISIQRQLKGNVIVEVGYVGVYANNLYQGIDFGNVPYMMKVGGQTFAQAYDQLYYALSAGKTPSPQPFFQTALAGSPYCAKFANCTQAVASQESGNILTQSVTSLWSDLDSNFTAFGPALTSTNQCFYCYAYTSDGYSNYNAMVVTASKHMSGGLTVNANFTWSHALGLISTNQSYTLDNAGNPFNLGSDYGPQFFDRRYVFNLLGSYVLPFGKGHQIGQGAFLSRLLGGWTLSPIFSAASGLPNNFATGSYQEQGQAWDGDLSASAIPIGNVNSGSLGNTVHYGVSGSGAIATVPGQSGENIFANPVTVFNEFRPFLLGVDGRTGGAGTVYGLARWNLDLGLTKDTQFTERVGAQIFVQAFNLFNHMQWQDPSLSLQNPAVFGVLGAANPNGAQYGALTLGGSGASANYSRIIQLGLRIHF
jgi:hypothetical protein